MLDRISTVALILSLIFMRFAMGAYKITEWDSVGTRENELHTTYQNSRQAVADQKESARQADIIASRYGENNPDTRRYRQIQSHYDLASQTARKENTDAKNHYG
ncbi:hypothetical protein PGT21_020897 [Puccinia graminis f. sp. tritici]|uniref:Uncharacterized protein n=1 Tax=Puccinia graminis f. sp. tritici TaxID=56615 RepID=A0A5B0P6F0_PUCGR|nr:hypothetical protein PGT21_020897 [Puccinia graminis f. sp. tritici]KAA1131872.1 hypothetical protein PGTUg99_031330 [Puccinia graminis f. sp. tritici]